MTATWNFNLQWVFHENSKSTFTWEAKWTQTGMRFNFGWKSHFSVHSALYLCSHELRRNEPQNGMDFISVILTEMKFQTGMRFSCKHNLPETKWISADSLDVAFNVHQFIKPINSYSFEMSCFSCSVFSCVYCFFLKTMKLYKDICSAWIGRTSAEIFFS